MSDSEQARGHPFLTMLGSEATQKAIIEYDRLGFWLPSTGIGRFACELTDLWEPASIIVGFWQGQPASPSDQAILFSIFAAASWRLGEVCRSTSYMSSKKWTKTISAAERRLARLKTQVETLSNSNQYVASAEIPNKVVQDYNNNCNTFNPFSDLDDQLEAIGTLENWFSNLRTRTNPGLDKDQKESAYPSLPSAVYWLRCAWAEIQPRRAATGEFPSEPTRAARRLKGMKREALLFVSGKAEVGERDPDFVLFSKAVIALQGSPEAITPTRVKLALERISD